MTSAAFGAGRTRGTRRGPSNAAAAAGAAVGAAGAAGQSAASSPEAAAGSPAAAPSAWETTPPDSDSEITTSATPSARMTLLHLRCSATAAVYLSAQRWLDAHARCA